MTRVSIVINNYNYGRFLADAVDSALAQVGADVEVVVVDDGSTDESRDVLARYTGRVVTVLKENGGQATAFNAGFAACSGDVVCFLDSDDACFSHRAAAVAALFDANPEAGWVFHGLRRGDKTIDLSPELLPAPPAQRVDCRAEVAGGTLPTFLPATSAMCFRRSLLARLLPMPVDIRITSDNYLKLAAAHLAPGVRAPERLSVLRVHGDNAYTHRTDRPLQKARVQVQTGYWLNRNFPGMSRVADKLVAFGVGGYGGRARVEPAVRTLVDEHLATIGPARRAKLTVRAALQGNALFKAVNEWRVARRAGRQATPVAPVTQRPAAAGEAR